MKVIKNEPINAEIVIIIAGGNEIVLSVTKYPVLVHGPCLCLLLDYRAIVLAVFPGCQEY